MYSTVPTENLYQLLVRENALWLKYERQRCIPLIWAVNLSAFLTQICIPDTVTSIPHVTSQFFSVSQNFDNERRIDPWFERDGVSES